MRLLIVLGVPPNPSLPPCLRAMRLFGNNCNFVPIEHPAFPGVMEVRGVRCRVWGDHT